MRPSAFWPVHLGNPDGVPFRGVGGHVRSPVAVGQVRGAAGNASPMLESVSSATDAAM